MKKGDTSKWTDVAACENLLFFSQLVNELLFDYSIPSNRISTLNSHYLALDALSAIATIENKGVPEGTLKPIVEELYCELEKDSIFEGNDPLEYFIKSQGGSVQVVKARDLNYAEEVKCVKAINSIFFAGNSYFERLKDEIIKCIKLNGMEEQQRLFRLTKSLLTELMNSGYSLKYIYFVMDKNLWKPRSYISSPDVIEDFFKVFDFIDKDFEVVFKVKWSEMQPFIAHVDEWNFLEKLPDKILQKVDKEFRTIKPEEKYLLIKRRALDPYSAAERAVSLIEGNASVYRLYNHEYRYDIRTADYRALDDKKAYNKGKSINAVGHMRMPKQEQIDEGMSLTAELINGLASQGNFKDYTAIFNAVKYHSHSLDSRVEENQLLDLWAIFESVLDISSKHTTDRINQICEYLVPILKHKYVYSLFNQLAEDIRIYNPGWYDTFVSNSKDTNEIQRIAEFVLLDENKAVREAFCKKCYDFPLLKERIAYYNTTLKSKQNVYEYVEKHAVRVQWHVMRIYRNRNLIIHNAQKMPYLKLLVENLHSYVDEFVDYVIHASSQNKDVSSMCQDLFVRECKWNTVFRKGKSIITKEDIEVMLSV